MNRPTHHSTGPAQKAAQAGELKRSHQRAVAVPAQEFAGARSLRP